MSIDAMISLDDIEDKRIDYLNANRDDRNSSIHFQGDHNHLKQLVSIIFHQNISVRRRSEQRKDKRFLVRISTIELRMKTHFHLEDMMNSDFKTHSNFQLSLSYSFRFLSRRDGQVRS